jgi:hypothetical protein
VKRKLGLGATLGALLVALTLVLTGCGGNGDSNSVASLTDATGETSGESSSTGASEEEREQALLEYAQCMREHGVDMPDPINGRLDLRANRGEEQKVAQAQEACRSILEDVAPPALDEAQQAELQEAALDYARCMREHGVDMPDPQFEEGGGVLTMMPEGAEDDPQFDEAQEACQPILEAVQPDEPSGQSEGS